jgi:hypothetical protein
LRQPGPLQVISPLAIHRFFLDDAGGAAGGGVGEPGGMSLAVMMFLSAVTPRDEAAERDQSGSAL